MKDAILIFSETAATLQVSVPSVKMMETSTLAAVPDLLSLIREAKSTSFTSLINGNIEPSDFFRTFASASTGPTPVEASCISSLSAFMMTVASGLRPSSISLYVPTTLKGLS